MFDVTAGENGEHLYYLFDASEDSWINGPEEKPIELTIEDEKTEDDIMKILNEIVHKDYVNYASSE
jgi:hypothetical protein